MRATPGGSTSASWASPASSKASGLGSTSSGSTSTSCSRASPTACTHGEDDQEDFLVLSGECLLIVEGEERRLGAWDFVHCPPWTEHAFVGAGDGPCLLLAVGSRTRTEGSGIRYPVNEAALRHGAGVETETSDPDEAYARFAAPRPVPCPDELPRA